MAKIAYNACYGGFSLSHAALMRYAELKGLTIYPFVDSRLDGKRISYSDPRRFRRASEDEAASAFIVHYCTTPDYSNDTYWDTYSVYRDRSDAALIQVIEELGDKANDQCSKIKLVEMDTGTLYRIDEYDGMESVATQSTYDWKVAP